MAILQKGINLQWLIVKMLHHSYIGLLIIPFLFSLLVIVFNKTPKLYIFINQLQLALLFIFYLVSVIFNDNASSLQINFISSFGMNINISIVFDTLAKLMSLIVIVIGACTLSYSQRYLSSDSTQARFLTQMNFVICSVLLLVMAGNLFTAFIAWQFIGLSLYVLLNHYHYDLKANQAAKKKFIINRIGDLCFLSAVVLVLASRDGSSFAGLALMPDSGIIALLVFIAIMTKSAQFPFHIWLPDTLETPTPVSALMHAGVINAGGILMIRCANLFMQHKLLLIFVMIIGILTAIIGGVLANQQCTVKKQLAYSTMSQMGYMVFQCGTGLFVAALFHLIAHGFLKGYAFLNSGDLLFLERERTNNKLKIIISSLLTALVIIALGICFANKLGLQIPFIFWIFIYMTVIGLLHTIYAKALPNKIKTISAFIILIFVLAYILLLQKLTNLIGLDYFWLHNTLLQIAMSVVLISTQVLRWCGIDIFSVSRMAKVEELYRTALLNPLRSLGEFLSKKITMLGELRSNTIILLITVLLFLLFLSINFYITVNNQLVLFLCQGIILFLSIVAMIIANRANKILTITFWILLVQVSILTIIILNRADVLAQFYAINIGCIFIILFSMFSKHKIKVENQNFKSNTLSAPMFYFSCALICLIGVPGTANFIGELYLFKVFLDMSPAFMFAYALLMLMLAIVIMHTLQVYVFRIVNINISNISLSKPQHILFILLLMVNFISGIVPNVVLAILQRGVWVH